ncbi:MAG TPA: N-acetyltransferase [Pirellulaceae bacterium]|nr:N-acetyltransferase [Pirellulaceae bacterium]
MSLVNADEITIKPVTTWWEKRQFLHLPWKLYHGDPNWTPPLRQNQKELVGYARHPFYDQNKVQTFLAYKNREPVGRVAAIVNNAHVERFHEQRGFFGFFEAIDDQRVATGLLDAARNWLAEQGMTKVRGPINPSLNYEVGTLVDGFYEPATFMMTYNPPYHDRLITGAGFAKSQDMYAFWGHVDMLKGLDQKLEFVTNEAIRRFNVVLRPINRRKFKEEVRMFLHIYNASLAGTWGFTPLSDAEIDHAAHGMQQLIVPEMTTVAEVDGKPVAAVFGLLDYNPRIKLIDGRLFPFGFIRLLWNRKQIKRVRLISTNVLPEFQRWGLGLVVLSRLVPEVLKWGIQEAEFSWVLESNHLSFKTLQRGGAKLTKTYRVYDYAAAEQTPSE